MVVSLGHTDATFDQMLAGIDAGATLVTHLFSAMSPLHHRAPGAVGAALTDERADRRPDRRRRARPPGGAEPGAARQGRRAASCWSPTRSRRPARRPGPTRSAGTPVISDGESARLADGTLAGSTLTMDRAVRGDGRVRRRAPRGGAAMATRCLPRCLGFADRGRLAVGRRAEPRALDWKNYSSSPPGSAACSRSTGRRLAAAALRRRAWVRFAHRCLTAMPPQTRASSARVALRSVSGREYASL